MFKKAFPQGQKLADFFGILVRGGSEGENSCDAEARNLRPAGEGD
jgi:hypothetical protein